MAAARRCSFCLVLEFHPRPNQDPGRLRGLSCQSHGNTGPETTYGALELGVTLKLIVSKPLALVALQPEIRYKRVLAGRSLFNSGDPGLSGVTRNQITFGGDVISAS